MDTKSVLVGAGLTLVITVVGGIILHRVTSNLDSKPRLKGEFYVNQYEHFPTFEDERPRVILNDLIDQKLRELKIIDSQKVEIDVKDLHLGGFPQRIGALLVGNIRNVGEKEAEDVKIQIEDGLSRDDGFYFLKRSDQKGFITDNGKFSIGSIAPGERKTVYIWLRAFSRYDDIYLFHRDGAGKVKYYDHAGRGFIEFWDYLPAKISLFIFIIAGIGLLIIILIRPSGGNKDGA